MKKGQKMPDEIKQKISKSHMGIKHSLEVLDRIAATKARRRARGDYDHIDLSNFIGAGANFTRGKKFPEREKDSNPAWRGDDASYVSKHRWVARHFGKPMECTHCGTKEYHRYEWANISGRYFREEWDWIRLCVPCHRQQAVGRFWIEVEHDGTVYSTLDGVQYPGPQ